MIDSGRYSITEIERETGIRCDTLRVWERRYGFPTPQRNERGERFYSSGQLSRLRLLKKLMDRGMQPGKLIKMDEQQMRLLIEQSNGITVVSSDVKLLLELLIGGVLSELQPQLEVLLQRHGLQFFLTDIVAPMNYAVGDAWFSGKIGILDEHYYSEQIWMVLTKAQCRPPYGKVAPKVLLTTLPGEPHGIGLMLVAGMLGMEGAEVLSLGVQTPLEEIVRGALENQCSIVGISCSEYMNCRAIASQLVRLRKMLPESVFIWAGGSGVHSMTLLQGGIQLFTDLRQIPMAIEAEKHRLSTM